MIAIDGEALTKVVLSLLETGGPVVLDGHPLVHIAASVDMVMDTGGNHDQSTSIALELCQRIKWAMRILG